ncbi:sigma-70 family RNA polymerase sigma factor [Nocardia sp. FBN12]|uniref:sigma-70 family RNA polymerase sigma factor n=1 Tax=Nocardia sp. FBN12 TaxID=3419766 RepID=UPI003CFDF1A8
MRAEQPQASARAFEQRRDRLRGIAYRMVGSAAEAEDAVQEAWLRLAGTATDIADLDGWLTTVVSRICLDMLRARTRRAEVATPDTPARAATGAGVDPEAEALRADSVGRALLIVLGTLGPEERVAFVLHDLFAVPFAEIAPMLRRTPATTKKLASRARLRVHAPARIESTELLAHRAAVTAFAQAAGEGDLGGLLAVLAPDVVRTADPAALSPGMAVAVRGARAVAEGALALRRRSRDAVLVLVDGRPGLVVAGAGGVDFVVTFRVRGEQIAAYDVAAAPERVAALTLSLLPEQP